MTLNNIKKMRDQKGFTIVELLIVIVIIGILAALVIVAYTGIQNRARATQYQTDAQALDKKAEAYNASAGNYPLTATGADAPTITAPSAAGVALTGVFNSTTVKEGNLPSNLAIFGSLATTGSAPTATPTFAQAMTAVNYSTTVDYYFVWYCATGKGMRIYYPDPTNSTVKTIDAGTCP